jgi:hypothetical protein
MQNSLVPLPSAVASEKQNVDLFVISGEATSFDLIAKRAHFATNVLVAPSAARRVDAQAGVNPPVGTARRKG